MKTLILLLGFVVLAMGCFHQQAPEPPLPPQPQSIDEQVKNDVPIPEHFTFKGFLRGKPTEPEFILTLTGTQPPDTFIQGYRASIAEKKWVEEGVTEGFGGVVTLIASKKDASGQKHLEVIASTDAKSGETLVTISVSRTSTDNTDLESDENGVDHD